MVNYSGLPSPLSIFSAYASMSASIMLFQTMVNQVFPHQVQDYIFSRIRHYFKPLSSTTTLVIEERDGMSSNEIYEAAEIYLYDKISPEIDVFKLSKQSKEKKLRVNFAKSWKTTDIFEGVEVIWRFVSEECKKTLTFPGHGNFDNDIFVSEKRHFELSFDKKYKDKVLNCYMPFVLKEANVIKAEKKVVKLHTLGCSSSYSSAQFWDSINFEHPSTFDTLAMDAGLKKAIIEDLDRFLRRKEFYKKVGKVWKRGYLLYGPPGTGKSSLIAAMANYLKFDIFDLELANVKRDSDLKKLLLRTTNKSILVIEDIDCSMELPDRRNTASLPIHADARRPRDQQFTLAGLLNFIDGLWSSCGDERVIIFTTNNKDKIDPALLRPGRMDMHIHMSYLTIEGFTVLAKNYLKVHDHQNWQFKEIQELIESVQVTPAEVAEELIKSDNAKICLERLVKFLKRKRMKNEETEEDGSDVLELFTTKRIKSFDNKMNSVEVI
ncbi:AAA-ATPase At5g17760-like [Nicotiana sylvestris]|uniref:Probable mitochondrial chaperone BCS1-B n=1 Tax=Nicotiana sylvestris TaxID=4096 RepID=A0A1U7WBP6_NICSY|nr:PREDICTED: probable mitochondrial chaperone BCS1-B [Nicotiana sylvestris]